MESVSVALGLLAAIASSRRFGFHRLIAVGGAVTDAADGVTPSSVSYCGKIQKNLSVGQARLGPTLAVRELVGTISDVSSPSVPR